MDPRIEFDIQCLLGSASRTVSRPEVHIAQRNLDILRPSIARFSEQTASTNASDSFGAGAIYIADVQRAQRARHVPGPFNSTKVGAQLLLFSLGPDAPVLRRQSIEGLLRLRQLTTDIHHGIGHQHQCHCRLGNSDTSSSRVTASSSSPSASFEAA